jgi:3-phenylpropionate/trans-cinnamate dioxygenase ferredoxin reductase subunit
MLGQEVNAIFKDSNSVKLNDGTLISYDKLLIATGGKARVPNTPGIELKNIHVLRNAND